MNIRAGKDDALNSLHRLRTLCVLLATLAAATPAPAAGPETPSNGSGASGQPSVAPPAAPRPGPGDETESWQALLQDAELRVKEAQRNAATARHSYNKARSRRYPRGKDLQAIRLRSESSEAKRHEAERKFSQLVELARRGGVPAGVLTPFMDLADEIRQQRAESDTRATH